ncbi:ParB N-terminal domain-containing protein [Robiginitomaculum antarcticum]|uniref:ParB N-terminal domain-containing protein n=1 Tax=Robiginitomaculum antarcticum TaxID=437507 RepID=UPI000363DAF6|nr:ParB N-terminal domain-containing protein [Robiginitomaculum antarcticum]
MRIVDIKIQDVYIPAAKKSIREDDVEPLAEDILENGLQNPIYVREGKGRYVLQEGAHRLAALKLLGETYIAAKIVQARKS